MMLYFRIYRYIIISSEHIFQICPALHKSRLNSVVKSFIIMRRDYDHSLIAELMVLGEAVMVAVNITCD